MDGVTRFAPFWVNTSSVLAALRYFHLSTLVDIAPVIRSPHAQERPTTASRDLCFIPLSKGSQG